MQKKKEHNSKTIVEIDNQLLSNNTVTTWRDEVQEKLNEKSKQLKEQA